MKILQRTGVFITLAFFCVLSGCREPTASDVSGVYASQRRAGSEVVLTLRTNGSYQRVHCGSDGTALRFNTNIGTWSFDPT
jgi:hypothetical protein